MKAVEEFGVSGLNYITTAYGPERVFELIGKKTPLIVNGEIVMMESEGFFKVDEGQIFEIETSRGFKIAISGKQQLLVKTNAGEYLWQNLDDKIVGKEIVLSNHRSTVEWKGIGGTFGEGWLLGEIVGDGWIDVKNHSAAVLFFGQNNEHMANIALKYTKEFCKTRADLGIRYDKTNKHWSVYCVGLKRLLEEYGILDDKSLGDKLERTSSDMQRGFIRGFFDADGCVQGTHDHGYSVRLSQSDVPRLEVVQRMLSRLGIGSSLIKNRRLEHTKLMPGKEKLSHCKAQHELIVSCENIKLFAEIIGFHEPHKIEGLNEILQHRYDYIDVFDLEHFKYDEEIVQKNGTKTVQRSDQSSQTRKYVKRYGYKFTDKIIRVEERGVGSLYSVKLSGGNEFCINGVRTFA